MTLSCRLGWLFKRKRLSRKQLLVCAYPILLFFSGIWQNPIFAMVIAGVYEVGLVGLFLVNEARYKTERLYQYAYVVLGGLLMFTMLMWLETLYKLMPYVSTGSVSVAFVLF